MRVLKQILLLILIYAFQTQAKGQMVPGFLGKRLSLQSEIFVSPALGTAYDQVNYQLDRSGWLSGKAVLNFRFQGGLNWTVSKRSVLGLGAGSFRTGALDIRRGGEIYSVQVKSLGGVFKWHIHPFWSKGSLAPLGAYTGLEFGLFYSQGSFDSPDGLEAQNAFVPELFIVMGRRADLSESFLIDFGFQLGLPIKMFNEFLIPRSGNMTHNRSAGHMLFNFFIGFHLLAI